MLQHFLTGQKSLMKTKNMQKKRWNYPFIAEFFFMNSTLDKYSFRGERKNVKLSEKSIFNWKRSNNDFSIISVS